MFTRIEDEKIERSGNYRIKARAFTNEYKVYDDIGCSTRLYQWRKNFLGRTKWRTFKASAPISVRVFYLLNSEGNKSIVVSEETRHERDNYVSRRAPRIGVQIKGTIGDIFDPNEYQFKIDAHYLDWSYIRDGNWEELTKAFQQTVPTHSNVPGLPERKISSVRVPVDIRFPKNKVRQFDGVIGFHAAQAGGHEFRLRTEYNVSSSIVVPPEFISRLDFYTPWVPDTPQSARPVAARTAGLRAYNGQYVCAEAGGGRELVANRDAIGEWETFELIDLGNEKVALRAHNGQYVCAEAGGGRELVANRDAIGEWETFELIDLGNEKVALRAHNGQYVCAEAGGGRELVANRDEIHGWETFQLMSL